MEVELKEFVKKTLIEIDEGARAYLKKVGAQSTNVVVVDRDVEFEITIVAKNDKKTKGGIGLFVGPISLGSAGSSGVEETASSKIKFKVPIPHKVCKDKRI